MLHRKFRNLIGTLIYEKNWYWLHFLISTLCDFEMFIKCILDKQWKQRIDSMSICGSDGLCDWQKSIPKNTFYCEDCPYRDISCIAEFFFGYQCCGYCWYLGKGDYSFIRPTELIWDGCKDCGIYEYKGDYDE